MTVQIYSYSYGQLIKVGRRNNYEDLEHLTDTLEQTLDPNGFSQLVAVEYTSEIPQGSRIITFTQIHNDGTINTLSPEQIRQTSPVESMD